MSGRRAVSWLDLPPELLPAIVERLGTRTDTYNFRLVCNSWRVSSSYCVRPPQNQLSPIFPYPFSDFPNCVEVVTLAPSSTFLIRSLVDPKLTPLLLTVEEHNPGKLLVRRHLVEDTVRPSSSFFCRDFNPSCFDVLEIGSSYTIRSSNNFNRRLFRKVVLMVDPNCPTLPTTTNDYDVIVHRTDASLELISLKLMTARKITGHKILIRAFDDVVNLKGTVFAIDRRGRAYTMDGKTGTLSYAVEKSVGEGSGSDMNKRLAETSTGELFLVHRCPEYFRAVFRIYKMNDERNKWDEVEGIGDDRVLFVASDHCFFANTKELPGWRGNSMVFRSGTFHGYYSQPDYEIFEKWRRFPQDLDIVVYHFDTGDWKYVASHPRYSDLFGSRPAWVITHAQLFNSMTAVEKQVARDLYSRVAPEPTSVVDMSVAEDISPYTLRLIHQLNIEIEDASPNQMTNIRARPRIIDIHSLPTIKGNENGISQGTFEGVNVCLDLVPILHQIWEKYGDLMEGHAVESEGLLKWALESIAKMVIILQSNPGECLNASQAVYLISTFGDIHKLLQIRLDWLVPFVKTALAQHNENTRPA